MYRAQRLAAVTLALSFGIAIPHIAIAQGAGMLRPSRIAPDSRELTIPPTLAGFRLGEATKPAQARLGTSPHADTLGSGPNAIISLTDSAKGISIFVTRDEGVGVIMVTKRDAGTVDGIRVGDQRAEVVTRWGAPAAGGAHGGLWLAGPALVSAVFDDKGQVTRLGIGTAFDGAGQ